MSTKYVNVFCDNSACIHHNNRVMQVTMSNEPYITPRFICPFCGRATTQWVFTGEVTPSIPVRQESPRQSSIELKMSAKGERYWDLKAYVDHNSDLDRAEAENWLVQTDAWLWQTYRPDEPRSMGDALEKSVAALRDVKSLEGATVS